MDDFFSRRTAWHPPLNRLARARAERRDQGAETLDLTESNPTKVGIAYPLEELSQAIAAGARHSYEPDPRGIVTAREALATELQCSPDDIVITASTSEAYSFLFKLLADPGDAVLTAIPSYPLLEHLAALELVELRPFALEFHRRWEIDPSRASATVTPRTKAIVVVNPNNPTGSYVRRAEQEGLARLGIPIVSDEVFFDYPIDPDEERVTFLRDDLLSFSLGGLSKSCGLPHYKLGWIRVSGPPAAKQKAIDALDLIADDFLSVGTPVQAALPDLLRIGSAIRAAIRARIREDLDILTALELAPSMRRLPVEGGWSAVIRVPQIESDEELALRLLDAGVIVHPGYFFDFESDGYLVVSLLPRPDVFAEGIARVVKAIPRAE